LNKFLDDILNIATVNRTLLTVILLFNIFSLQFTAVFPLFYRSAGTGTRSIKFLLVPVEISGQDAVEHLNRS